MIGRTGRNVNEKIYIFGKKSTARNIDEETENRLKTEYKIGMSALTKGYVPIGETYVSDYCGK